MINTAADWASSEFSPILTTQSIIRFFAWSLIVNGFRRPHIKIIKSYYRNRIHIHIHTKLYKKNKSRLAWMTFHFSYFVNISKGQDFFRSNHLIMMLNTIRMSISLCFLSVFSVLVMAENTCSSIKGFNQTANKQSHPFNMLLVFFIRDLQTNIRVSQIPRWRPKAE